MRTIVGLFVLCIFSVCVGNINAYTVPELKAEEFLQDVSEARTLSHIKKLAGFLGDDPEESLFKTLINRAVFITNDNASDAVAFTQTLRKPEWKSRFFEAYISFYGLDIEGAFSFLVFFMKLISNQEMHRISNLFPHIRLQMPIVCSQFLTHCQKRT